MDQFPSNEKVHELQAKLSTFRQQHWMNVELFSLQWWLLVLLMIVPWIIWWRLIDKKRMVEILLYGFFVIVTSTILDDIGSHILLWDYHFNLTPLVHQLGPINLSVLPISFMVIYQYCSTWKSFFIWHVFLAAGGSFVVEPFFAYMGIYELYKWKFFYSFPIYILIALLLRLAILKIINIQHEKQ
ncbi:CBO0543 family protein [Neobacillus sp. SM06]|uniref:CBO0543 family protein n=1 Tax=Neobacillus sp. SM06 TaxID=3422492 RepID=UPI003D2BCF20